MVSVKDRRAGHVASHQLEFLPCGAANLLSGNGNTVKKTLVVLVAMLALIACSNNKKKEESPAPPPPTLGQLRPAPAPLPAATVSPKPVAAQAPRSTVSRAYPPIPMSIFSSARTPDAAPVPEPATTPAPARAPASASAPAYVAGSGKVYILKKGDTLAKIAREHLGDITHLRKLINANPGIDHNHVYPGQAINLP